MFKFYLFLLNRRFTANIAIILILFLPSLSYGQSLLCWPWSNVVTGSEIGDSFTSQINDGGISFFGEKRPVAFAQLIYSHPLNDIFLAGSGEIVTAGLEGQRVRINVYFPNKAVKFFVTTSCSRV